MHTSSINSLADIKYSYKLISCGQDQYAKVVRYSSSTSYIYKSYYHSYPVRFAVSVASSSTYSNNIVTVTSDNSLHFWAESSSPSRTWRPHSSAVVGIYYLNTYVVTADSSGKIVWNSLSGYAAYTKSHSRPIVGIVGYYNRDDYKYYAAIIDTSGYISLWDKLSGKRKEFLISLALQGAKGIGIHASSSNYNINFIVLMNSMNFEVWNVSKTATFTNSSGCFTGCASNKYMSSSFYCSSCSSTCKTCVGTSSNCTSCNSPNIVTPSSSYYSIQFTCAPCGGKGCSVCQSTFICSTCIEGYYLPYGNPGTCDQCYSSNCATCNVFDYKKCYRCKDGYYKKTYSTYDSCSSCYYKCKTCNGYGSTKCTSCKSKYSLKNGKCEVYNPVGIILGSVFGGIFFIIFCVICLVCTINYRKKNSNQRYNQNTTTNTRNVNIARLEKNNPPKDIPIETIEMNIEDDSAKPVYPKINPLPNNPAIINMMNPLPNNPNYYEVNNPNYMYMNNMNPANNPQPMNNPYPLPMNNLYNPQPMADPYNPQPTADPYNNGYVNPPPMNMYNPYAMDPNANYPPQNFANYQNPNGNPPMNDAAYHQYMNNY